LYVYGHVRLYLDLTLGIVNAPRVYTDIDYVSQNYNWGYKDSYIIIHILRTNY